MTQIQKTILKGEITTLLETICEQFETLNTFEEKIPILEFEIIKDNVRKLYEKLYLLQRLDDPFELIRQNEQEIQGTPTNNPLKDNKPEETGPVASFFTPVQTIEKVEEPSETKTGPVKIDRLSPETFIRIAEEAEEPLKTGTESIKIDLPPIETSEQTLNEKDKPLEINKEPVKVDLFTSETSAFNDKLKEAREQSLGPRFRQPNTGDIKSFININEKFLFINELFDGDYKDYTHTIETFNTFSEKSEAFDFLDSLLKNNLWNSTSHAFLKLKEIVEKRFS
jgi:hypothetical protein